MSKKRFYLAYNPVAGKSLMRQNLSAVVETFSNAGYELVVRASNKSGDIYEYALNYEAERFEGFIVCGGDGSFDEALDGIRSRHDYEKIHLGYIPCGTTNDFANCLNIPSDPVQASEIIIAGQHHHYDIGLFNKTNYFAYVVAFGIFTDISYVTPQSSKNNLGYTAYILQGLSELFKLHEMKAHHLKITYDEGIIEDDFILGIISNSDRIGGIKDLIASRIDLNDGLFEVNLLKMITNPLDIPDLINKVINNNYDSKYLCHFQTRYLHIESTAELSWTKDGEYGGTSKDVEIENIQNGISLYICEDECNN